jgi:hypothetical protein
MNLRRLISPVDLPQFLDRYWGQCPLLVERSAPRFYDNVLEIDDVENFLIYNRVRYPEVRLIKNGRKLAFDELFHAGWLKCGGPAGDNSARIAPLFEAYQKGYTIIIRSEKVAPALAVLSRDIEQQFHHPVIAELFLTPSNSQGSLVHTDPHDVFVLQVSGAKHWRVYAPPANRSIALLSERISEPMTDTVLRPGDMLYVPRGYPHEALTDSGHSSLHLSVGVYPLRWYDLALQVLQLASEQDRCFAEPLPAGFLHFHPDHIEARSKQLFEWLLTQDLWGEALNRLAMNFCESLQPLADRQFAYLDYLDDITLDDVFELRPGMLCRLGTHDDLAVLAFPGSTLRLPIKTQTSLQAIITSTAPFTVRDLPSNLDDNSRLVLIKHLLKAGLIRCLRTTNTNASEELTRGYKRLPEG